MHAGLTLSIALIAGVLAQSLARHLNIPSTVLLLPVIGILGAEALFAAVTLGVVAYYRRTRAAPSAPAPEA